MFFLNDLLFSIFFIFFHLYCSIEYYSFIYVIKDKIIKDIYENDIMLFISYINNFIFTFN